MKTKNVFVYVVTMFRSRKSLHVLQQNQDVISMRMRLLLMLKELTCVDINLD